MRALATVLGVAPLFALAACMSMPFYVAAVAGDTPALQGHLSAGTPVDKPNTGGYTALTYAASNGHPGAVRFLLERGANPDHRDDGGRTPLDHALASPSPNAEVLSLLRAARTGGAPLSPAPAKKYVGVEGLEALAAQMAAQRAAEAPQRPAPGNLDDAGYDRMRAAAGMPAEQRLVSDVDSPKTRAAERLDDFALVVGIEQYSRLPAAKFAERDADAVKKHLLALGYPERNIITLKGGQATRGAMQGYVEEWLPRNVKPASRVFVYFSGHGSPDTKTGDAYLVPWDGDAMFLKSTAYPLKSLYASLAKLKAKRVLVALDSCFSGAGGALCWPTERARSSRASRTSPLRRG
ncbi:MAG: ankyrin repeat domain-containing protein [Elusimicrobiota bacterium]|nr:MAG: ankyrin repeat domain-containing protein [Elusimicrobiota bacterium]